MNRTEKLRITLILLSTLTNICAQQLPTVAVLYFEARGVSNYEAATLTDRLATELGNTDAVTLVERQQLDRILQEQGLQQSGCTSMECVAEVGQLLGVEYMISGSVNKLGNTFTVEAKMFSITTGENVKTVSKTSRGEIDELIPLMEDVAWELVGLDKRKLETVAVLDFEGRGISQLEAATLTDRFTSSLGNTEAVLLVARQEMNEILDEQGFKQKEGCTSVECAAEVGALLGVKNIVNGAVGKIGETYTIDAQMIAVATGATIKTVNKTYRGEVDGLITEIEVLAWEMVSLDPPQELLEQRGSIPGGYAQTRSKVKTRTRAKAALRSVILPGAGQFYSGKPIAGLIWLGGEAALLGMLYTSIDAFNGYQTNYNNNMDLYRNTTNADLIAQYKAAARQNMADLTDARKQALVYGVGAASLWLLNLAHAYITGPDGTDVTMDQPFQLVYGRQTNSIQMRWEIALD